MPLTDEAEELSWEFGSEGWLPSVCHHAEGQGPATLMLLGLRRLFYFCICSQEVFAQDFMSMGVYKQCVDVALSALSWVTWWGISHRLDSMTLKAFSNLNDSRILCCFPQMRCVPLFSHCFEPRCFPAHQLYLICIPKLKQNKLIAKRLAVQRGTNCN